MIIFQSVWPNSEVHGLERRCLPVFRGNLKIYALSIVYPDSSDTESGNGVIWLVIPSGLSLVTTGMISRFPVRIGG